MAGKVVNLRTARKQRTRAAARADAGVRAAAHGERADVAALRRAESDRADRSHEGHRRDRDPE